MSRNIINVINWISRSVAILALFSVAKPGQALAEAPLDEFGTASEDMTVSVVADIDVDNDEDEDIPAND